MTMTLISTTTLTGSAASISVSSIPSSYTDLLVVTSLRTDSTSSGNICTISFNGLTTNFNYRLLYGSGSVAGSGSGASAGGPFNDGSGDTANTFGNASIYVPNYAGSTNKSYSIDHVYENNATSAYQGLTAGLWSNTSAINQVTFTPVAGNLVSGTTISVYGILKGSGGATVSP